MFEDDIMLKNHRSGCFNKQFHHHNNYTIINNTITTIVLIEVIIIRNIIAINLTILVFRQIINETVNMIKINNMIKISKKITITIFNLDIKILNQLINKIFFQSVNNNVSLKHFRNRQNDKDLHEMRLLHFRR